MREPAIPQAAIQAAHDAIRQMAVSVLEGACCGKPDAERTIAERVLRAALPHLINDESIKRAAEVISDHVERDLDDRRGGLGANPLVPEPGIARPRRRAQRPAGGRAWLSWY